MAIGRHSSASCGHVREKKEKRKKKREDTKKWLELKSGEEEE